VPGAYDHAGDRPKYAPNSFGEPYADETGVIEDAWWADGEMVRQAYTLREDDDDFSQPRTMINEVFDDAARERFVENVAGHILGGVKDDTLPRVFEYWKNVDPEIGKRIEEAVYAGRANPVAPRDTPAEGVIDNPPDI
jgi:catalase